MPFPEAIQPQNHSESPKEVIQLLNHFVEHFNADPQFEGGEECKPVAGVTDLTGNLGKALHLLGEKTLFDEGETKKMIEILSQINNILVYILSQDKLICWHAHAIDAQKSIGTICDIFKMRANTKDSLEKEEKITPVQQCIDFIDTELLKINGLENGELDKAMDKVLRFIREVIDSAGMSIAEYEQRELERILDTITPYFSKDLDRTLYLGRLHASLSKVGQWREGRYSPDNLTAEELAVGKREISE